MIKEVAIIIGNGTSRWPLNLQLMAEKLGDNRPVTYGCNAVYRDFAPNFLLPDYIVAVDDGMINEIAGSDFPYKRVLVPPFEGRWEPAELHPNGHRPRTNAGMCAMQYAIDDGARALLCVGFDSFLQDAKQSVSNIYDGSDNYGMETRANILDNPGRVKFMQYMAKNNPEIDFIFAYPNGLNAVPMGTNNIFQTTFEGITEFMV
jgi:hypothetical protein